MTRRYLLNPVGTSHLVHNWKLYLVLAFTHLIFIDDQSAWWYYRFIISWLVSEVKSKAEYGPHLITLLEEEILSIEELVEEEGGNCKWGILALEMTRHQLSNVSDSDKSELKVISTQQLQYLIVSDKDRANRYLSMIESKNC